jgi:tetratricopeptide (TPR) repeat protein
MNRLIAFFALSVLCSSTSSQIQNGKVREQNSRCHPISGAEVLFVDAVPTASDNDGNFRLAFEGKKPGDLVFFAEIRKHGYELVNGKDLEILKISSSNRLGEDIIMAEAGTVDAAKKEYYGVSDKALLASFDKKYRALQEGLKNAELGQKEYLDQLTALQEQFDRQKQSLDALADKFARVNFDDVDSLYREGLELFKAGNIEACKKNLEDAHLVEGTNLLLQERLRIERGIKGRIPAIKLQAQAYLLTFESGKAEALYDQLVLLDSTDLAILSESADFYRAQNRYDKAKQTYTKITVHPQAEVWQIAYACCRLGELHTNTGSLPDALDAFTQYHEAYKELTEEDPSSTYCKGNLAISYCKLGETHTSLGNSDAALTFYKQYNELESELYSACPQNVEFKNGLAISYEKLGETHSSPDDLPKALALYQKYNELEKELYESHPEDIEFKNNLAISYCKLGETYSSLDVEEKALTFFEQYNQLEKELCEAYPQNVGFKSNLAMSYCELGEAHISLGNVDTALMFYEQYGQLEKELCEAYPQNVEFKNNLAISYSALGRFHRDRKGDTVEAKSFFQQCYTLWKELSEAYPSNAEFRKNLLWAKSAIEGL